MTIEGKFDVDSVTAGADLTGSIYKVINLAGTIVTGSPATSRVAGVLRSTGKTGEQVSYVSVGKTKAYAGAAVSTLGYPLVPASGGFLIAASSGGPTVGRALATAASGDLVPVFVDFMTIPAWPGV